MPAFQPASSRWRTLLKSLDVRQWRRNWFDSSATKHSASVRTSFDCVNRPTTGGFGCHPPRQAVNLLP